MGLLSSQYFLVELIINLSDHLERLQTTGLLDGDYAPVVETTFPELSEVYRNFCLIVLGTHYIPLVNLVPGENRFVFTLNG